jgi:hypothetical protein
LLGLTGCHSGLLGAGVAYDAGTLGVSGIETGVGLHLEAIGYRAPNGTGIGLGPVLQIAGYTLEGDGDPLGFSTLEVRYRQFMHPTGMTGAYWAVSSGAGAAWAPALTRVAPTIQAEIGVQTAAGWLASFHRIARAVSASDRQRVATA